MLEKAREIKGFMLKDVDIGDGFEFVQPDFTGQNNPSGESLLGTLFIEAADFGLLAVIALGIALMSVLAYAIVAKFKQCQKGQAEWGELMVLALIECVLLIVVAFLVSNTGVLLSEASKDAIN